MAPGSYRDGGILDCPARLGRDVRERRIFEESKKFPDECASFGTFAPRNAKSVARTRVVLDGDTRCHQHEKSPTAIRDGL